MNAVVFLKKVPALARSGSNNEGDEPMKVASVSGGGPRRQFLWCSAASFVFLCFVLFVEKMLWGYC